MSETVGAALKAAREQRRLTLAQVSESTKVRIHYLQALENDDISAMPSAAQARGFLRLYVDFLGLDLERLIPPPAAVVAEPPAAAEAATTQSAGAQAKPGLLQFLTGLRARITSRRPDKSSADTEPSIAAVDEGAAPPSASSETAQPPAPAADKKKQSR
jgi:transcriptional regulator with XRE-family HTH domain